MGLFSKLFGRKNDNAVKREGEPDVINVATEDERMNWGMEKARLTLRYFEESIIEPKKEQQYFSVKVKIIDGDSIEHIWLTAPSFDQEGNLFGVVGNKPVYVTTVKENQMIGIDRKLISDWMILENGKLIGGYTIRALRDGFKGKELMEFDKSIGLNIDEGVDYFEHNFDTPEGAILCIEDAYDEGNIEKVILCKDFKQEARIMLQKIGTLAEDKEIIKSTAEVLKMSFMKSLQEEGMPKFKNIKRAFPYREIISENHYVITEVCWYPDGGKSVQRLNTFKTTEGWRVLHPAD